MLACTILYLASTQINPLSGLKFIDTIAPEVYQTHNTVLLEKNSHFEVSSSTHSQKFKLSTTSQHIFAFPRLGVIPINPNKAFVPYDNAFHAAPPGSTSLVRGVASQILSDKVVLQSGESVPYEYLVMATGTGFPPLRSRTKVDGIEFSKALQARVKESDRIVVVGGGAYGVRTLAIHSCWNGSSSNVFHRAGDGC
jgi:hypothetical protein